MMIIIELDGESVKQAISSATITPHLLLSLLNSHEMSYLLKKA